MMKGAQPRVGIACSQSAANHYFRLPDRERLAEFADVTMMELDVGGDPWGRPPEAPEIECLLSEFVQNLDVLIVSRGAPRVTTEVIASAPSLRVVGDIEGDRFSKRIDAVAAREAGLIVIDTSHASSWPVAEWALALMLFGLRRQGSLRPIMEGREVVMSTYRADPPGRELTSRSVGFIGFGHIAWRLRELLMAFHTPITVYDPYVPREFADALDVDFATLADVMRSDVVVCMVPETPETTGMIGRKELALLRRDAVFINVARGVVVDTEALIERANCADAWFGLDTVDPEPIPLNSPLRTMSNVMVTPHIAGLTVEAQPRFFALMVDELHRWTNQVEPRAQITDRVLAGRSLGKS